MIDFLLNSHEFLGNHSIPEFLIGYIFGAALIIGAPTIFLLLVVGIIFIALLFYTFETLLIFSIIYLLSLPVSFYIFKNQQKKYSKKISDEDHEDIL